MNRRDIEEILKLQRDIKNAANATPSQRIISDLRKRNVRNLLSTENQTLLKELRKIKNGSESSLVRNENFNTINTLREIANIKNYHTKPLNQNNFVSAQVIKELEKISRYPKAELDKIKLEQDRLFPRWQREIFSAFAFRKSEIDQIFNNTKYIKEKLGVLPSSFYRRDFWDEIDSLRNTFAGNLAIEFRNALESSEDEDEVMAKVESIIKEKILESPNSFNLQNTLALIVSILSLVATIYFNTQKNVDSNTLLEKQSIKTERLIQATEQISKNTVILHNIDKNVYYVVMREVDVKNQPSFKSISIDILFPNSRVKLIAHTHKWIYIEWTDYLEGIPRYGWVSKKYLKRVK